jgi:chromosome condensin MukBEF ATPase and DNA-binding subunit MukB
MADDNDEIAARLAAMEADVMRQEAAAEEKRVALLREVAKHENDARKARSQYEDARRKSLGENINVSQVRLCNLNPLLTPAHSLS